MVEEEAYKNIAVGAWQRGKKFVQEESENIWNKKVQMKGKINEVFLLLCATSSLN